ncbi:Interphotoreceptor retinol-binding [Penicillium occitanis (nom. inval.)]|nr:Interphotoreceptor retinol-binding [Penicillium occitanis (nom. inval.)]PCG92922.1 hypothetical protein PENOC_090230 [Penicillium occitanis (nom. inval.)]
MIMDLKTLQYLAFQHSKLPVVVCLTTCYTISPSLQSGLFNATQNVGKKKIIIDVQNNGGGVVVAGYALLIVFSPNETIYSDTPFRTHEAMGFIGTIINYGNNSDNSEASNSGLVVTDLLQPDQTPTFENWNEVYGPYTEAGVPVSALVAEFNFADDANSVSDPINIDGEGGELNARTPPFAPEDIIILTDGRCSSTCTLLVDQMASKGVRTVAVGGRPRAGVMQANYRRYQRV